MSTDIVERSDQGPVSILTLNRPTAGNALSLDVIRRLKAHLTELEQERSISVIVLRGAGAKIFCAGHDLKEVDANEDPEFFRKLEAECCEMMLAMRVQPQIIVAAVDGVATAAGCQLVAAADLAVATRRSRFATPGVNIGLWCITPMVPISRAMGAKHAMQLLVTGELHSSDFALRSGLINEIVDDDALDAHIDELAARIAGKSSYTLALGKRAFYAQLEMSERQAYEYVSEVGVRNLMHHDAKEGIRAFVEKRPPVWKGR